MRVFSSPENLRSRYPGPKPYAAEDEDLFFGREEEKDNLISLIKTNKVTVLFGRSGFGKSSLIEAGIIPYFEEEYNYKIIQIRFESNLDDKTKEKSLQKQIIASFKKDEIEGNYFFNELGLKGEDISLWQVFKTLQWELKDRVDGILFIMDQFEQVFSFPESSYKKLAGELSEVVYNRVPLKFQNRLLDRINKQELEAKKKFIKEYKEKIDFIQKDIPIAFLIGMRSDRLYFLDEMGDDIPLIFGNRLRLRRLNIESLADVIRKPAKLSGNFKSPPFAYSDEAIEKIKNYLAFNKVNPADPKIETFQLQIICEYIEENIVGNKKNLTVTDLPDLSIIIQDYYKNIIGKTNEITNKKLFTEPDKLLIRFLIERKLIDKKTSNRICLDKIFTNVIGFDDPLLDKLIETRIIRREPNTVSGQSIELSHDTLIEPIIKSSSESELGDLDKQLTRYYNRTVKEVSDKCDTKNYKVLHKNLEKKFVTEQEGNLNILKEADLSPYEVKIVHALASQRIIIQDIGNDGTNIYTLNEAFQDVVIKKIRSLSEHSTHLKYVSIVFTSLVAIVIIIIFAFGYRKQLIKENAFNVALLIDQKNGDSLNKLLALNEAYERFSNGKIRTKDSSKNDIIVSKLVDHFNRNYFLGKTFNDGMALSLKTSVSGDSILVFYNYNSHITQIVDPNVILKYAILYKSNGVMLEKIDSIYDADFNYTNVRHIDYKKTIPDLNKRNRSPIIASIIADTPKSSIVTDTVKNNKTKTLFYDLNDIYKITINNKHYKTEELNISQQAGGINRAYFSATGDTVFIITTYGNVILFDNKDNDLKILSRFYLGSINISDINQTDSANNQIGKINNVIAVINNNKLVIFNLRDPQIQHINTTNPKQISNWINQKGKEDAAWIFAPNQRETFGFEKMIMTF